jgi:hypothetical protein
MAESNTNKYPSGTLLKALPKSEYFRPMDLDRYWVVVNRYQNEDITYMVNVTSGRGAALASRHITSAFDVISVPNEQ